MYQPRAPLRGALKKQDLEHNHTLTTCHPDQPVKRARVFVSARVGPEGSAPLLFLRPQAEPHSLPLLSSKHTLAVLIFLVATMCRLSHAQERAKDASLAEIVANPAQYHGQTVRVRGFLLSRFENRALYINDDDLDRRKSLWLANTLDIANRIRGLAGQYVVVEGTIDAKSHGHMNKFAGTIVVTKVDPDSQKSPGGNKEP